MQREPFLTSVWIIICSAVLISLAYAYMLFDDVIYGYSPSNRKGAFWVSHFLKLLEYLTIPVFIILACFHHLRGGVNYLTATIIIISALIFLSSQTYFTYEYMVYWANEGGPNFSFLEHIKNDLVSLAITVILYLVYLFCLWTGIAMLRCNPNNAIKPETFE